MNRKLTLIFLAILMILVLGCNVQYKTKTKTVIKGGNPTELAVMYTQTSGEYAAICHQTFYHARTIFNQAKEASDSNKKLAVVVDVDETVLDNTPYQVEMIIRDTGYPDQWDDWCKMAKADPMPGALEFCKFVEKNGGVMFYVTNRKAHLKEGTVKNLKDKGFPFANNEHVRCRTAERSKEPRRDAIKKDHEIVLLMGDNLNDLTNIFEERGVNERKQLVNDNAHLFGTKFLVLPNPMYGDWENPAYKEVGFSATKDEKHKARMKLMHGF